jgi:hypothetical protein
MHAFAYSNVAVELTIVSRVLLSQLFVNNAVDPVSGQVIDPSLSCVGSPPLCTVSNFRWSSVSSDDRHTITIPASDANACASCTYTLALFAGASSTCVYIVTASTAHSITSLVDGVAFFNFVARNAAQYYSLTVTSSYVDVEVDLTPFFGDAYVYISWHSSNSRPGPNEYDAVSAALVNETVYVQVGGSFPRVLVVVLVPAQGSCPCLCSCSSL